MYKFVFISKKNIKTNEVSNISEINGDIFLSNINRNNMMLKVGKSQTLELYRQDGEVQKLYDFGNRPAAWYNYSVKNLEGVYDINGDGEVEIILKSVNKVDVMGQGYEIEIYKFNKNMLMVNRILTKIEEIFG